MDVLEEEGTATALLVNSISTYINRYYTGDDELIPQVIFNLGILNDVVQEIKNEINAGRPTIALINNYDYDIYYENTFILGDATKELSLKEGIWHNSNNIFIDNTNNWFIRGGVANQENSTIYSYSATTDKESNYITTRIVTK